MLWQEHGGVVCFYSLAPEWSDSVPSSTILDRNQLRFQMCILLKLLRVFSREGYYATAHKYLCRFFQLWNATLVKKVSSTWPLIE